MSIRHIKVTIRENVLPGLHVVMYWSEFFKGLSASKYKYNKSKKWKVRMGMVKSEQKKEKNVVYCY